MATQNANIEDAATGLKKVWGGAVTTIQSRLKDVEKVWNDTFSQVNTRLQDVEKDVREFVGKVESDGKKRFDLVVGQLKLDEIKGRIKPSDLMAEGARLTSETIEKFGLATNDELQSIAGKLDKLAKQIGRGKPATDKDLQALAKRVSAIEKALGTSAPAKKAPAKKAPAKKAPAKKAPAKKAAAKS